MMKHLNKMASVFCVAAMALTAMTGCEGSDIFSVDSPDWISEKIDSIEKAKNTGEEVLEGMNEDVYTVGATDFSTGWWTAFSKYYQVEDNQKWNAVFNLNINPSASNTYKNFALIISNDEDRGATNYKEYGAIRFDNQPQANDNGNSEWGDYIDRSLVESNLTFATNTDKGIEKLGGKVTLTVDRSKVDTFLVKITNGTVTKTYVQPSKIVNLNTDASDTKIRCCLVPEGSYIDFLQSNVEPIGGYTSAADKAPVSMVLNNVPSEVDLGTDLNKAMEGISATVTFEEGVTKVIPASELYLSAIPDMDEAGEKTLVVIYNKTFKGENASTPIVANAKFNVVNSIKSIKILQAPTRTAYYYYSSAATSGMTNRTLAFDPTGMVVAATDVSGNTFNMDNSKLTYSTIPAKAGSHKVTISTENGKTAEITVKVAESKVTFENPTPTILGAEDNSTGWWQAHSNNITVPAGETRGVSFTNYCGGGNWNNFVIVLRYGDDKEYGVVRADNYGWGTGVGGDGCPDCVLSGGQADWATWLAAMNGAKVDVYVTNCNNGKADVQAVMHGTDGKTYIQYYLGVNIDPSDLKFGFTVDSCHLVFGTSSSAKRHSLRRK